jgi:phage tail sheath gpL-like
MFVVILPAIVKVELYHVVNMCNGQRVRIIYFWDRLYETIFVEKRFANIIQVNSLCEPQVTPT